MNDSVFKSSRINDITSPNICTRILILGHCLMTTAQPAARGGGCLIWNTLLQLTWNTLFQLTWKTLLHALTLVLNLWLLRGTDCLYFHLWWSLSFFSHLFSVPDYLSKLQHMLFTLLCTTALKTRPMLCFFHSASIVPMQLKATLETSHCNICSATILIALVSYPDSWISQRTSISISRCYPSQHLVKGDGDWLWVCAAWPGRRCDQHHQQQSWLPAWSQHLPVQRGQGGREGHGGGGGQQQEEVDRGGEGGWEAGWATNIQSQERQALLWTSN